MPIIPLAQVLAFVGAAQQIVGVGIATVAQVRAFFKTLRPDVTDADLNAICDAIAAGAARHEALANADLAAIRSTNGPA